MFVAMGLSAVVPIIHGTTIFGVAQLQRQIGLSWLISQGAMYILGAAIYAVSNPQENRNDLHLTLVLLGPSTRKVQAGHF